jgi:S-adenosylmethionine:tRNA ribosyltransferase-isomerase
MNQFIEYFPQLNLEEFDYNLPKEKIAQVPLKDRPSSKLLYADCPAKEIKHYHFKDLQRLIPEGSLLILNDTKVIPARIFLNKPTGGKVEVFCIEPIEPTTETQTALQAKQKIVWNCIASGHSLKPGLTLEGTYKTEDYEIILNALLIEKTDNIYKFEFSWQPDNLTFAEIMDYFGSTPLPPYIIRHDTDEDSINYQTVYAEHDGSVAAPTAGLHFTEEMISKLRQKNISIMNLTLHVGLGTFKPIDEENISNHQMHSEKLIIPKSTILDLIAFYSAPDAASKTIAVGTTSLRSLETLYWIGVKWLLKMIDNPSENIELMQYEPYYVMSQLSNYSNPELYKSSQNCHSRENGNPDAQKDRDSCIRRNDTLEGDSNPSFNNLPTVGESFFAVLDLMNQTGMETLFGTTSLFIVPGYEIRTVKGLITNFHIPKSTLILLVAAFSGGNFWREIYNSALENEYRFLSYGDSSFLRKA